MIRGLIASALLLATGCSGEQTMREEIASLESAVVMPEGTDRLDGYTRFYAVSDDAIEARYLSNTFVSGVIKQREPLEPLAPNIFLVGPNSLPIVMDGGCSVLSLRYDRRTHEITGPVCNGVA